ncbi:hypothetical protein XENOCAPTIV_011545 [Xenoophorus captivus]|uniref:Uncharacterized protein n=1 Tax=Xenoophorus captivus TaxID=1517983 RepID=A0ABV0R8A7_9TELE
MINTVRIERLSDDEDVDITDDLSEGEGGDIITEFSGPAGQPEAETETPTERPTEEQKDLTLLESINETTEQPCQRSPSGQSPPSAFMFFSPEEVGKTTSDENVLKTEHPEIEAQTDSKVTTNCNNYQSSHCDTSAHTGQLTEACHDFTEQAVYNRPKVVDRTKPKEGKDVLEAYQLAQRLQSMVGS